MYGPKRDQSVKISVKRANQKLRILIEEDIVAAMKNKSPVEELMFEGRKSK